MGVLHAVLLMSVMLSLMAAEAASGAASRTPRVALLFASRGEMPLEPVWLQFFSSVKGLRPPALSDQQWREVMEDERVEGIKRRLHEVGRFTANSVLQNRTCADNVAIKVRCSCTHSLQPASETHFFGVITSHPPNPSKNRDNVHLLGFSDGRSGFGCGVCGPVLVPVLTIVFSAGSSSNTGQLLGKGRSE
jgi:hypothetical protein